MCHNVARIDRMTAPMSEFALSRLSAECKTDLMQLCMLSDSSERKVADLALACVRAACIDCPDSLPGTSSLFMNYSKSQDIDEQVFVVITMLQVSDTVRSQVAKLSDQAKFVKWLPHMEREYTIFVNRYGSNGMPESETNPLAYTTVSDFVQAMRESYVCGILPRQIPRVDPMCDTLSS